MDLGCMLFVNLIQCINATNLKKFYNKLTPGIRKKQLVQGLLSFFLSSYDTMHRKILTKMET